MIRALIRLATVLAVLAAALLVPAAGDSPVSSAQAADATLFDAGNIISDGVFFDGLSMDAAAVQTFLTAKGASCTDGQKPCLKNYRQDTADQPADAYCAGYRRGAAETAATIIAKVGASCGINPRVLLVLLQKEQGLITTKSPTTYAYTNATGFGCPDTAACDPAFSGIVSQLYFAARQFQRYAAGAAGSYRAGRENTIAYAPATKGYDNIGNARCGTSQVYIANKATAGLYSYTPYRPNAAALAAGYGTGDSCSTYGNRNFYLYYTDWFGSTQSPGGEAILARASAPGASTTLGAATSGVRCGLAAGGCYQSYQKASIYWSPATGAQVVRGAIFGRWGASGWEGGLLGYPTGEEWCGLTGGGCFQPFQGASIYYSPTAGTHAVGGAIGAKWAAQDWEKGPMGYPTSDETCGLTGGGCFQAFQGARVYWSPATAARTVTDPVYATWAATKWETGPLGYPTGDTTCGLADSGCSQTFQNGSVYFSASTGGHVLSGAVLTKWTATKAQQGPLGYPTNDTTCGLANGGCYQQFQKGSIYATPSTGAHTVTGPVLDRWAASRWETGPLGYPTTDTTCQADGGCTQDFQYGAITWTSTVGAHPVTGAFRDRWVAAGRQTGALGYPTNDQACGLARGGCYQLFQDGGVYSSASTAAASVSGDVWDKWSALRWENGPLGYPTRSTTCGLADDGCFQTFEGGSVYSASTSKGPHTIWGSIYTTWAASSWERGVLGYPTGDEVCGLTDGGCSQQFENGAVYWSPSSGARIVTGAIGGAWTGAGADKGALGYPLANQVCGLVEGGCYQQFQRGSVYWTDATGAHAVSGAILSTWGAGGWERGTLGYPTADAVTTATEITQQFQRGTLVQNRSTGAVSRR
ncbi:Conserved protein of unknown function; putative LGFP domains [Modestobacter italicus]|uniref:LGFP repeat-containing protein n=1 Tax=Modestobacter italicus (strain DSM 44449 / CECT 9708 / BC 501) TaxID=2732864 RepID=I4F3A2_MODI5|nr:hypothetical protein [Modestobacter marinus]CCH90115.1 Conserved protein of unknown function; putative LGFP domains [Modestobacter marinus]